MTKKQTQVVEAVWDFYEEYGRHDLPWRLTTDPYQILVSEIMLQQTQVERVIPKYEAFIKKWPTAQKLAKASLGDVLRAWQGLGYNRRAKMLHQCVREIVNKHGGVFPATYDELQKLPGIGPYTAGAVLAFAFNTPVPIIETNIRTVYLYHFFKNKEAVSETDLLSLIEKTLDVQNSCEWYWALMDYGSHLKKLHRNLNKQANGYAKQSKFKGSDREVRGAILRVLSEEGVTENILQQHLVGLKGVQVMKQLQSLRDEGMVVKKANRYSLPG